MSIYYPPSKETALTVCPYADCFAYFDPESSVSYPMHYCHITRKNVSSMQPDFACVSGHNEDKYKQCPHYINR